ncbi:MAG: hypothetical protein BWK80_58505 [Desulfobacteraceae bacterium IS3]|nr:MAG: hypothetical protein BWK80_58505 [Desulfobacteraceae bacterium IS3]HAO20163.1 hypothetical protein [Desulfobacteraceae bacterium]
MEEIKSHLTPETEREVSAKTEIGHHRQSLHNSPFCGDAYNFWHKDGITHLVMADGLGHGNLAELAAVAALDHIRNNTDKDFADLFRGCDAAIRHTRGVAMGVARIDEKTGLLRYAGIGNTRAMVFSQEKMTRLTSNFGIVGGGFRKLFIEEKQLLPNDLVIMFTDGLHERANITAYGAEGDLMALAYRIFQDYHIVRDDAAIMIYRMT